MKKAQKQIGHIVRPFIIHPSIIVVFSFRLFFDIILYILNVKIIPWGVHGISLKDISAIGKDYI